MNLILLGPPRTGGWVTFTYHLALGCRTHTTAQVWRLGKHTETHTRPFARGMNYLNASLAMLEHQTRTAPTLITAAAGTQADQVAQLRSAGAGTVIHDPTELTAAMRTALAVGTGPVFTIRPAVQAGHLGASVLIPHPYAASSPPRHARPAWACAYSRLDWDKGTAYIAAANETLPPHQRVHMWGTENRLYTHNKITPECPHWRAYYHGPWPAADTTYGLRLAARHDTVVDMSAIKGDGGGTQYTFLEAIDARADLLLSTAWLTGDPAHDTIRPHARFADPTDLDHALREPPRPPDPDARAALLALHDAATISRHVLSRLEGSR